MKSGIPETKENIYLGKLFPKIWKTAIKHCSKKNYNETQSLKLASDLLKTQFKGQTIRLIYEKENSRCLIYRPPKDFEIEPEEKQELFNRLFDFSSKEMDRDKLKKLIEDVEKLLEKESKSERTYGKLLKKRINNKNSNPEKIEELREKKKKREGERNKKLRSLEELIDELSNSNMTIKEFLQQLNEDCMPKIIR